MARPKARQNNGTEPAVLDVKGLRDFLGGTVALSTIYKALREGRIPHRRLGNRILISRRQLLEWLEGRQA
jgi:excisionase family DNA binding protein